MTYVARNAASITSMKPMKRLPLNLNPIKTIQALIFAVAVLFLVVVIQSVNLSDQRKMTLEQSNYCIKYTSDILATSHVELLREEDAHARSIETANAKIEDLVTRYNSLLEQYKKKVKTVKLDPLLVYSFLIK
jgi:hypothetical protein